MGKKRTKPDDPPAMKTEEAELVASLARQIANWVAGIVAHAKTLQKMDEPVRNLPLGKDRRRILKTLSTIPSAFKERLLEENPEFTVAEITRIGTAISQALPEARSSKRNEMWVIARSLLRSAHSKLIGRETKPRPKTNPREETAEVLETIIGLIDQFCPEHLNDEYAVVCRKLAEKLARKRPSPLLSGSPNTWASGIVRTVGWVNFLHDKSQTPYMRLSDIDAGFGISESSGAAKLAAIRKMLKIQQLDPNWTLPSRLDDNPMVWMLEVNGFMIDVRHAPREVQEIAFNKGLIPYIPADRQQGE
jgi:Domain of unknown function (DUF6398)